MDGGSHKIHFVAKPSRASTRGQQRCKVGGGSEREEARRVVLEPYYWPPLAAGQRRVGFTARQVRRRGKYARRLLGDAPVSAPPLAQTKSTARGKEPRCVFLRFACARH